MRLLIESVETDLSRKHENMTVAKSTQAWLLTLRERIVEIEENTEEAFKNRRDLVKLLVEKITVDRSEDRQTEVQIIYRFGPPPEESASFVDGVQSFRMGRRSQQRSRRSLSVSPLLRGPPRGGLLSARRTQVLVSGGRTPAAGMPSREKRAGA